MNNFGEFLGAQHLSMNKVFDRLDSQATGSLALGSFSSGLLQMGFQGDTEGAFHAICPEDGAVVTLKDLLLHVSPRVADPLDQHTQVSSTPSFTTLPRGSPAVNEQLIALREELLRMQSQRTEQHLAILQVMEVQRQKNIDIVKLEIERAVSEVALRIDLELQQMRKQLAMKLPAYPCTSPGPDGKQMASLVADARLAELERRFTDRSSEMEASLSKQIENILRDQDKVFKLASTTFDLSTEVNCNCAKLSSTLFREIAELKSEISSHEAQISELWRSQKAETSKNNQMSKNLLLRLQTIVSKVEDSCLDGIDCLPDTKSEQVTSGSERSDCKGPDLLSKPMRQDLISVGKSQSGRDTPMTVSTEPPYSPESGQLGEAGVSSGGNSSEDPSMEVGSLVVDMISALRLEVQSIHGVDREVCGQLVEHLPRAQGGQALQVQKTPAVATKSTPLFAHTASPVGVVRSSQSPVRQSWMSPRSENSPRVAPCSQLSNASLVSLPLGQRLMPSVTPLGGSMKAPTLPGTTPLTVPMKSSVPKLTPRQCSLPHSA